MPSAALPAATAAHPRVRFASLAAAALIAALALAGSWVAAQVEGDRGIPPIASSGDFEVSGVAVDVTGETADEARSKGWREAQRLAWERLYKQRNPDGAVPAISDSQIAGMVSAVVVEREQIGPRRYIATVGVIFDRARAGEILGLGGVVTRSAPMLVMPITFSGGAAQLYEVRTPWQRAWAEFRTGASVIDYVRPSGAGGESLLLNAGQMGRRSRSWWRIVLDEFGASDVIFPVARIERQWPGGPVVGIFTARFGPDNRYLDGFTMTAESEEALPAMLDRAVQRMDTIYSRAFAAGTLRPDDTLNMGPQIDPALFELLRDAAPPPATATPGPAPGSAPTPAPTSAPAISSFAVQFATPDAAALDAGLVAVRGAAGVQSAAISSVAIGGTSVMRVSYAGDLSGLAAALRARGFTVVEGSGALSIRQ